MAYRMTSISGRLMVGVTSTGTLHIEILITNDDGEIDSLDEIFLNHIEADELARFILANA